MTSKFIQPKPLPFTPPKTKKKEKDVQYVSFELTDYTLEELYAAFQLWSEDESKVNLYEQKCEFAGAGSVILEVFRFEKIKEYPGLFDENGNPLKDMSIKILPFGKILKAPIENPYVNAGDIVSLKEKIGIIETNPAWLEWNYKMINERPKPVGIPEPNKLIGLLPIWQDTSNFILDKFNPTEDDKYIFIRPINEFQIKYK